MKMRMFTIYDKATQAFHLPFFMLTVSEAKRTFADMANDENSKIHHHHTDFTLFHIGDYDDATGYITTDQGHVSLGMATEYLHTEAKSMENNTPLKGVKTA